MAAQPYILCSVGKNILKKQFTRTYPKWKLDLGKEIISVFENNPKILLIHYNALNSKEWNDLRYDMRQENMQVKVYPNRITCHYLKQTMYANICPLFRTDTAIAFSKHHINTKAVIKILRGVPKVELLGGIIDNTLMNKLDVLDYSNLPSLEQCRGELVQILSQPSSTLSRLLQTNQSKLSQSLSLYVEQQRNPES